MLVFALEDGVEAVGCVVVLVEADAVDPEVALDEPEVPEEPADVEEDPPVELLAFVAADLPDTAGTEEVAVVPVAFAEPVVAAMAPTIATVAPMLVAPATYLARRAGCGRFR